MKFSFDYSKMLDSKIESELMKNKNSRPLVLLAKKYGIKGTQIISFIADLSTVSQQMQQEDESK